MKQIQRKQGLGGSGNRGFEKSGFHCMLSANVCYLSSKIPSQKRKTENRQNTEYKSAAVDEVKY